MKKNAFTYFLMCLCLLFLTACPVKMDEFYGFRSYVLAFGESTMFRMEVTERNNILLYWTLPSRWSTVQDTGLAGIRYDEFATRYNDLSYNRKTRFMGYWGRSYISNSLASINIRSDTDFNVEHPAGTSLAHFVRLLSVSPIRFIESGYQETFNWHSNYPTDFLRETATFHQSIRDIQHHFPISEVLSELEPNDFRLIGNGSTFSSLSGRTPTRRRTFS